MPRALENKSFIFQFTAIFCHLEHAVLLLHWYHAKETWTVMAKNSNLSFPQLGKSNADYSILYLYNSSLARYHYISL